MNDRRRFSGALLVVACTLMFSCSRTGPTLFERIDSSRSGILFENKIVESPEVNILTYEYTYNGGGVAAADFNNDGLCDLYFSGNTVSNRLFINKGDLKFVDVTETSGTSGRVSWKTGVTATDVNGDGWIDIYLCYSGPDSTYNLSNQLFINNGGEKGGNPSFTERAAEFGLDAPGTFSTQSAFFDYDRDGDLDMFLINHGNYFYSPFVNTSLLRKMRHPRFGNRLYRNDSEPGGTSGSFTDVSSVAGIHGGGINFGLGVAIGDVNADGWPDTFVTNDYEEQDYLYINRRDGTFTDVTKTSFGHLSRNGMGTDMADFNNDGKIDILEVDMWPEDNYRQKLLKGPDDYNRYQLMLDSGFHHQQMRNTLQLNAGARPDSIPLFCEIGQMAGVSSTDWSWAPLFLDVDNDGFKDIFVSNGYLRDFTSMDFLKYTVETERMKAQSEGRELELYSLIGKMPSTRTADYLFRNNGDLTFTDITKTSGLSIDNLSFGAAYADLDNDGDLEIILNNTNEQATLWLNHSSERNSGHFLQVVLNGARGNPFGVGARVTVVRDAMRQVMEHYPSRGFQSSVSNVIHFGLGENEANVDIEVIWSDGRISMVNGVKPDQRIEIPYADTVDASPARATEARLSFTDVTGRSSVDFRHRENAYNDFDHEPLLPYMLSRSGPALAAGDVDGDGHDDFYIGGAAGQAGELYLVQKDGRFIPSMSKPWMLDASQEDTGAVFFDADGDDDLDLFVVSGGNEYPQGSPLLDDRLYINEGRGVFSKAGPGSIVADHSSGSCVTAGDYDKDGDMDLFVGGRVNPGKFPQPGPGAILRNESDGKGPRFVLATADVNQRLRSPGMVTDARWTDFNKDGWMDLIVVGEWMPVMIFENRQGKLSPVEDALISQHTGLWRLVEPVDVDGDGDDDYILGNAGTNLPWRVSSAEPMTLYYDDFNDDDKIDPIICAYIQGKSHPIASRDELLSQMVTLRKKFTTYASYGDATIEDVLTNEQITSAGKLTVTTLRSSLLLNEGNGRFSLREMPAEAQVSSIMGAMSLKPGEILFAGNFFPYRTQVGPSDAGLGGLLRVNPDGYLTGHSALESGFAATGDVRKMVRLKHGDETFVLLARNNDKPSLFRYSKGASTGVAQAQNSFAKARQ